MIFLLHFWLPETIQLTALQLNGKRSHKNFGPAMKYVDSSRPLQLFPPQSLFKLLDLSYIINWRVVKTLEREAVHSTFTKLIWTSTNSNYYLLNRAGLSQARLIELECCGLQFKARYRGKSHETSQQNCHKENYKKIKRLFKR